MFKIIGYPEWWDFSKPRKKIAGKVMVTFTNEIQSKVEDKPQPTANVAHPGIVGKANVICNSKNDTWIIDTSASNHIMWSVKIHSSIFQICYIYS